MRDVLARLAPYVVFVAVVACGLGVLLARQAQDRRTARRQVCEAIVDQRRTLAGIIALAVPAVEPVDPTLPPAVQALVEQSRRRTTAFLDESGKLLAEPIPTCEALNVDTRVTVHGATPLPVRVGDTTSTPLTTTTTSTTRPSRQRATATRRPRRRSSPTTRPTSSTTAPSSPTTTAAPSQPCRVPIDLADRCPIR